MVNLAVSNVAEYVNVNVETLTLDELLELRKKVNSLLSHIDYEIEEYA